MRCACGMCKREMMGGSVGSGAAYLTPEKRPVSPTFPAYDLFCTCVVLRGSSINKAFATT